MKVKIARIKKRLTQNELAIKANICRLTISNIERGKQDINNLRLGVLRKLAKALDTTVQELFLDEE